MHADKPSRPKRPLLLAVLAGCLIVCALVLHHELTVVTWKKFPKELSAKDHPNFLWPLDTRSRGISLGIESSPFGDAIWAFGPVTEFRFSTYRPMELTLNFACINPIAGQSLDVSINHKTVASFRDLPKGPLGTPLAPRRIRFRSLRGNNTVTFTYGKYNHGGDDFAPEEPRPLSVRFTKLQLQPANVLEQGS